MKTKLSIFLFLLTLNCIAQKHDNHILTSNLDYDLQASNSWLDLSQKKDTLVFIPAHTVYLHIASFNVTMSDSVGNFIFFSNGDHVYDKNLDVMKYGKNINIIDQYNSWYDEGFLFNQYNAIPIPGRSSEYVFFYNSIYNDRFGRLRRVVRYNTVDMDTSNGSGIVVEKRQLLDTLDLVNPLLCKHANGVDWWIISADARDNTFYLYLLEKNGIIGPKSIKSGSDINLISKNIKSYNFHRLVLSIDGDFFISQKEEGYFDVFDFDRCRGEIVFRKSIKNFNSSDFRFTDEITDVCLSPNGKFLYYSTINELFQINLQTDVITKLCHYYTNVFPLLQNLPNLKTLIISGINKLEIFPIMALISNPNLPGKNADTNLQIYNNYPYFSPYLNALRLPIFPNYTLGKTIDYIEDECKNATFLLPLEEKEYFEVDDQIYFKLKRKYK